MTKLSTHTAKHIPLVAVRWIGITLAFLFSFWLMFHSFGYDGHNHIIQIGRTLWSDFGAHIPLIRSFSMGDNFDLLFKGKPEYPLYPGEPIRYHFLFYAFVGLLVRLGLRIDWALNIPSALGFFFLLYLIFTIAKKLFNDSRIAILSVIFFLFNGSLGFLRFFGLHPLSINILNDIIHASAFPAFAPWGPGDVSAFWNLNIYTNQRHLAAGFAIALGFIVSVLILEKKPFKKQLPWAVVWGAIVGILPYFHTPTLVIMAILFSIYFLLFGKIRKFLIVAGIVSALLVLPQLLRFPEGPKTISWYIGYLIHPDLTPLRFIQYWWQNLGLHALLIPIGFFLLPAHAKKILFPLFVIFLVANLFKFSVEVAGAHKFFNFSLILGNMISAYIIISIAKIKIPKLPHVLRSVFSMCRIGLLVGIIGFLTLSGIIDFFVVANDKKMTIDDIGKNEVATWIARNTPPSSIFLNSSFFYHPASLAGRKIFMGWPYFAWSAGYDSYKRMNDMKLLYSSTDRSQLCPRINGYNITYVTFQNKDTYPEIYFRNESIYRETSGVLFEDQKLGVRVYSTENLCPKVMR